MKISVKEDNVEQLKKMKETLSQFRLWCKVKYDMADSISRLMTHQKEAKDIDKEIKEICYHLSNEVEGKLRKLTNPTRRIWICIEATWSGYKSSQSRVVHREYRKIKQKDLQNYINKASKAHSFDDNTCNYHRVMVVDNKKKDEVHGYDQIVREIFQ